MVAGLGCGAGLGCSRSSGPPAGASFAPGDARALVAADAASSLDGPARVDGSTATETPPAPHLLSPAVFSAPIAGLRAHGELVVAGLVATEGVVRVMGLRDGLTTWTADVLRGVTWIPDAELTLQAAGDGVLVTWRGSFGGKTGTSLVVLGPKGEARANPLAIGAASCATADGFAWIEPRTSGSARVRARRWSDTAPIDVVTLSADRAPTLSCGDHQAFVLGDGDDDVTATAFAPGSAARPAIVAIRDSDFGDDDEREHEAFVVGDDLGVVRVGGGGAIAMRELAFGHATPWHRLKHALSADDEVAAVDGDASATLFVLTRESNDACPGSESGALGVRALRVDRKTGEESVHALAPADCQSVPGPFWVASSPGAPTVAWVHRKTKPGDAAPIDGLFYSTVEAARTNAGSIDVTADALVDAGCDAAGCFAAALLRTPDADGGRPEAILGLRYAPPLSAKSDLKDGPSP